MNFELGKLREFPTPGSEIRHFLFCDSCKRDFVASWPMTRPEVWEDEAEQIKLFIGTAMEQRKYRSTCPDCDCGLETRSSKTKYDEETLTEGVKVVENPKPLGSDRMVLTEQGKATLKECGFDEKGDKL